MEYGWVYESMTRERDESECRPMDEYLDFLFVKMRDAAEREGAEMLPGQMSRDAGDFVVQYAWPVIKP